MSSENRWTAADLRESVSDGVLDGFDDAPLLEEEDLQYLLSYATAVQDAEDTEEFQELLFRAKALNNAVGNGNLSKMAYASGIKSNRIDATGYGKLVSALKPAAQQAVFKGAKGSGKTTKAVDLVRRMHAEGVVEKVLTNIKGPDEHEDVEFFEDISRLLEFAKEPGEKVAIIDEFSTVGNAYTGQQDVEQVLSRVINALRKSEGGSLRTIFIGHENDTDIHPLVRKQSDVVVHADGKVDEGMIDKATIYRGWSDYKDGDAWFKVRGLQDVDSGSEWSFSTNYFAHLEFDLDDPEKQIQRGQLIDGWEEFQGAEDDEDSGELELRGCRGERTDGGDCGQVTRHVSGFCASHRDAQWCGDDDPRLDDE